MSCGARNSKLVIKSGFKASTSSPAPPLAPQKRWTEQLISSSDPGLPSYYSQTVKTHLYNGFQNWDTLKK